MNSPTSQFERPCIEPLHDAWRLVADWHTDCKGVLDEQITVPRGFVTDGASIPRFLWRVCGSPMDLPRCYAAIVHDRLYDEGGTSAERKRADQIYRDYQIALGISRIKAYTEYYALRMFGGSHWESKTISPSLSGRGEAGVTEPSIVANSQLSVCGPFAANAAENY